MAQMLQAGPVTAHYESGSLRWLTLGGAEVVRQLYFALRDPDWQTARLTLTDEKITQAADSFRVQYNWQCDDLGIAMTGRVTITGEPTGTITTEFFGEAQRTFFKNRVGLCVLHPLVGVTGQPCDVIHAGGGTTAGRFPEYISPYQPFLDIQTLRWQPVSGGTLRLDFQGDGFEMEDQRNWTDASFKTYCTPLARPFPAQMQPGDLVRQRIVFSIESATLPYEPGLGGPINRSSAQSGLAAGLSGFAESGPVSSRLRVGTSQRADWQRLSRTEADRLCLLNLSHLRADVFLTTADWQTGLTNALADAALPGVPLELALFFGPQPADELPVILNFLSDYPAAVGPVLIFDAATLLTSTDLLKQVIGPLRAAWPGVLIGGGTDGSFAEFNRNPFDYELVDFVVYSICPQVHAFDDDTIRENIMGQPPTVQTAHWLTGGKPVHISPVTLLPRYTSLAGSATERRSPSTDHRQTTDFRAEWTRLTLQSLADAGVASVTLYETHGPRGWAGQLGHRQKPGS